MSDVGDAINEVRAEVALAAPDFMPDLCSFTLPGAETKDGDGYPTTVDIPGPLNVPCSYDALSVFEREKAGGVGQTASHRLRLPANASTLVIGGAYRGVIAARGLSPALNFEVTGRLDSSTSLFLDLAIVLKG